MVDYQQGIKHIQEQMRLIEQGPQALEYEGQAFFSQHAAQASQQEIEYI